MASKREWPVACSSRSRRLTADRCANLATRRSTSALAKSRTDDQRSLRRHLGTCVVHQRMATRPPDRLHDRLLGRSFRVGCRHLRRQQRTILWSVANAPLFPGFVGDESTTFAARETVAPINNVVGDDSYVLCEINASSCFAIPEEAPAAIARQTVRRLRGEA